MRSFAIVCATFAATIVAGCAVGSGPEEHPKRILHDVPELLPPYPSLGALDHSCDYQLDGQICNDMISYDHYNVPDITLAQYKMSCKKPEIADNHDTCRIWSLRDSKGNSFGYPDYWAYCCLPPDHKGFQ